MTVSWRLTVYFNWLMIVNNIDNYSTNNPEQTINLRLWLVVFVVTTEMMLGFIMINAKNCQWPPCGIWGCQPLLWWLRLEKVPPFSSYWNRVRTACSVTNRCESIPNSSCGLCRLSKMNSLACPETVEASESETAYSMWREIGMTFPWWLHSWVQEAYSTRSTSEVSCPQRPGGYRYYSGISQRMFWT